MAKGYVIPCVALVIVATAGDSNVAAQAIGWIFCLLPRLFYVFFCVFCSSRAGRVKII